MPAEFDLLFSDTVTEEQRKNMLLILAAAVSQALAVLPDTEENWLGRAVLSTGASLALFARRAENRSTEELVNEIRSQISALQQNSALLPS